MIELEERGAVTIMRLARGKGNALNLDLLDAAAKAFDALEASGARAAVVTGQGSVFGAGVDLVELAAGGDAYVQRFVPRMLEVFERLATFPKPLVAAVNGHAIAGGAILMMACDQRILARAGADRADRGAGGCAVSGVGFGDRAVRHTAWTISNADLYRTHVRYGGSDGARIGGRTG